MRWVAFAVGLGVSAALAIVFAWPSASHGPVAIVYGTDACALCHMHLAQRGFAGELRDNEGLVTKYDDVGCLLRALAADPDLYRERFVEDHETGALVPLAGAWLVRSDALPTPMGYGVVAFRDDQRAASEAGRPGFRRVGVDELLRDETWLMRRTGSRPPQDRGVRS